MSQDKREWDINEFTQQASKFIEVHFKKALILSVVGIIGASVYAYKKSMDRDQEMAAFGDLYKITKNYNKKKADFAEAKEQATKKDKKTKKELKASTGDMSKDYGDEVEKLEAFVKANLGKNASGEAALILSEIYSEYSLPEKGAEVVSKTLSKWGSKNVLYYVMQMRVGDLWASSGQCDKATSYWQAVADGTSFISTQAQLKLGVCLQELGKVNEAKTWFEKIKANSPNSAEGFSAKRYLRFLEFKTKNSDEQGASNKAQQKDLKKENQS